MFSLSIYDCFEMANFSHPIAALSLFATDVKLSTGSILMLGIQCYNDLYMQKVKNK